jgi:hypothetical protein
VRHVDRASVTVEFVTVPAKRGNLPGDDIGLAEQVAAVGVPRSEAQRSPLSRSTDDDRHMFLQWPGVAQCLADRRGGAVEARRTLVPQHRQHLYGVLKVGVALIERREGDARRGVLLGEPADAEPADRSAAGHYVECGDLFGQHCRAMEERRRDDVPRRIRSVAAPNHARVTYGSGRSAHAGPTCGICRK